MKFFDTIAAIATPMGNGGISIIRISGEKAVFYAEKLVFPIGGKRLSDLESHKMTLSKIKNAQGQPIDEALAVVMRAPKSYTGEDVVEIHSHGGVMVSRLIIDELQNAGVRMAEAGEFTRRAFINGKTDLTSAEAVMDIIDAKSKLGLHNAVNHLEGALGKKIADLREEVLSLLARLSATADYPDEIDEIDNNEFLEKIGAIQSETQRLIDSFERGRLIRDGVTTVIVGKPNVGKSSLLNALLGEERAIVTDIPGTTRDTVEEYVTLGGLALHLKDTAGIRESDDTVEKIGIERAKSSIKDADLVLFVLDASRELSEEDFEIAKATQNKNTIIVLNKQDKKAVLTREEIVKWVNKEDIIPLALPEIGEKSGLTALEKRICERFAEEDKGSDTVRISSQRHRDCLVRASRAMDNLISGLNIGMPKDILYIDLEDTASGLGEITGETLQEEIVNQVFEKFCVGK